MNEIEHIESLDCPCGPVTYPALGGGDVQVHRGDGGQGERKPQSVGCPNCGTTVELSVPDPYCPTCGTWHYRDQHTPPANLLRGLEDKVRALPAWPHQHRGEYVERAAVVQILRAKP